MELTRLGAHVARSGIGERQKHARALMYGVADIREYVSGAAAAPIAGILSIVDDYSLDRDRACGVPAMRKAAKRGARWSSMTEYPRRSTTCFVIDFLPSVYPWPRQR